MLPRLEVHGFKNLVNVEVRFGPFTCIAGANGVGKSKHLRCGDFLRTLADRSLMEAALAVRDESNRSKSLRSLFTSGPRSLNEMTFMAEMIVPAEATGDLGQPARATDEKDGQTIVRLLQNGKYFQTTLFLTRRARHVSGK